MPRQLDIGWQHGTMIGGQRHHVQCNYCHRTMIGGITRFKKHLASKRGEIKGCEAVPKEVRETIKKHLAMSKPRKANEKKQRRTKVGSLVLRQPLNDNLESEASDPDETNARQELLALHKAKVHSPKSADQHLMVGTREFFDAFSSVPCKTERAFAPRRASDIGWSHGMMVKGDRQKIQCKYCLKIILGGGISRLKQHLAGERGNIAPCESVPEDVKAQMQQHLGFRVLERLKKQKEPEGAKSSIERSREGYNDDTSNATSAGDSSSKRRREEDEGTSCKSVRNKTHVLNASLRPQSALRFSIASQESIDQADLAIAKFMYDVGIPFSAANSSFFQKVANAIAAAGPGYKMPSFHSLRGKLLKRCVYDVSQVCKELQRSWESTGCTIMVDRWRDRAGRTMLNFYVYCPKGTVFLKSVDASDIENTTEELVCLFDEIIQDVGPHNVVNFLTDSEPQYKAAGRILMNRHKTFFSSICANHCIDLMLKCFADMDEVKKVLAKAKRICQFIYNNEWLLKLLKKRTDGRDIIQPAMTEFVMKFCTVENILLFRDSLHQMFTSNYWENSSFSRQRAGIDVTEIVLDLQFWISCMKIVKVSKPLIAVLGILDSEDRPSMGYLFDAMEKAKRKIISAFDNKEYEYKPYLEVIDNVCTELHSPLHAAAYYLNPSTYYNPSFSINNVIQKGLLDCIETLEYDLAAQDNITRHKAFYEDAVGDFSRPVAIRGRESLFPATWWLLYSSDYPDLQRFAVRILSQTCSIATSGRSWTMNECKNSNKNRLENERFNDLIFVHYNLHLQQRQMMALGSKSNMTDDYDPIYLDGRNNIAGDWIEDPGVLAGETEKFDGGL
ncbi:uncharacterized protein [Typha angustifolia]|uniref:uncharacterized protein isoform X1 n=4 Tax=Typha angustifolia TaxID=59011 RepID=UPI003C30AE64